MKLTYKKAGVDIDKQTRFIEAIKPILRSTYGTQVLTDIGGFAGLYRFDTNSFSEPVLVASTDGVGTKLKVASMANKHSGVGIDLVAMVLNDIVVQGAHPLFFLDYLSCGKLKIEHSRAIISGIAKGCKEAGCALIGGETAEMPGYYEGDDYDLVGFGVGAVSYDSIIDGSGIAHNDVLIGIRSSGLHSNGFSLVRKVMFDIAHMDIDTYVEELGKPLGEELLTPTRIYVKTILNILRDFRIKGMVHVTGGGFIDNIPRVLPSRSCAVIDKKSWDVPPIFRLIQRLGKIDEKEMLRTFNMGIGMILVVSPDDSDDVLLRLKGLKEVAHVIGHVDKRKDEAKPVIFEG